MPDATTFIESNEETDEQMVEMVEQKPGICTICSKAFDVERASKDPRKIYRVVEKSEGNENISDRELVNGSVPFCPDCFNGAAKLADAPNELRADKWPNNLKMVTVGENENIRSENGQIPAAENMEGPNETSREDLSRSNLDLPLQKDCLSSTLLRSENLFDNGPPFENPPSTETADPETLETGRRNKNSANSESYETAADVEQIPSTSRALPPLFIREDNETPFVVQNLRDADLNATQIVPVTENMHSAVTHRDAENAREVEPALLQSPISIEDLEAIEFLNAMNNCKPGENLCAGGNLPGVENAPVDENPTAETLLADEVRHDSENCPTTGENLANDGNDIPKSGANKAVLNINSTESGVNFKIEVALAAYQERNLSLTRLLFENIGDKVCIEGHMNASESNDNPTGGSVKLIGTKRSNVGTSCASRIPDPEIMEHEQLPEILNSPERNPRKKSSIRKRFSGKRIKVDHGLRNRNLKFFKCSICVSQFSSRKLLFQHKKLHSGNKKCNSCYQKFKSKQGLLRHIEIRAGGNQFRCYVCKKICKGVRCLLNHQKSLHSQDTLSTCNFCQKRFSTRMYMLAHRRTHTGEKLFTCEVCNKEFARKSYLKIHGKSHTKALTCEDKGFRCKICKENFNSLPDLLKHKKIHQKKAAPMEITTADRHNIQSINHNSNPRVSRSRSAKKSEPNFQNINNNTNSGGIRSSSAQRSKLNLQNAKNNSNSRVLRSSSVKKSESKCQNMRDVHQNQKVEKRTSARIKKMSMHNINGNIKLKCTICDKTFLSKSGVTRHALAVHVVPHKLETTLASSTQHSKNDRNSSFYNLRKHR